MIDRSSLTRGIRSGEPMVGLWMHIAHVIAAETLAQSGADFVLIDGEHAPIPPDALGALLPYTDLHAMNVVYRVRWNRVELIKAALDAGVSGLMIPMVNTAEEARAAVSAAKYPPVGSRGLGAWRASNYYLNETAYLQEANASTSVIVQIETKQAVEAVEEIAAVPGVDAVFVGPADLALSLGLTPGMLAPELLVACRKVAKAAHANGIVAGIDVASIDYTHTYRDLGFSLLTYGSDIGILVDGARTATQDIRLRLQSKN